MFFWQLFCRHFIVLTYCYQYCCWLSNNDPAPPTHTHNNYLFSQRKQPPNLVTYNNTPFIVSRDSVDQEFRQDLAEHLLCSMRPWLEFSAVSDQTEVNYRVHSGFILMIGGLVGCLTTWDWREHDSACPDLRGSHFSKNLWPVLSWNIL